MLRTGPNSVERRLVQALTREYQVWKPQDWRVLQLSYTILLERLTLANPAARIRGIPARTIILGLLRERAQDPAPVLAPGIRKLNRRVVGRHAVLDPRAQLLEQAGRLPARAAPAVREAGDLEEAVEVVGVAEQGLDRGVVVAGVAVGDEVVVLKGQYLEKENVDGGGGGLTSPWKVMSLPPASRKRDRSASSVLRKDPSSCADSRTRLW